MGERWIDTTKVFTVHPDVAKALKKYKPGSKDSLDKMFEDRNQILEQGDEYWNSLHDAEFAETAEENTDIAAARGWRFPQRPKKKR